MKIDHILIEVDRAAERKASKRTMGLSVPHNRHAKRQQSKAARQYDIDTEDYAEDSPEQMSDAPYAVGYSAQGHEWRGSGPYSEEGSQGRWKMYDDGRFTAINIPDYSTAEKLEAELEKSYEDGTIKDRALFNKPDDDYYSEWYGTWIQPMKKVEEWEYRYDQPKDYGKDNEAEPNT